jgi:DGQHR domain-containing protein
MFIQQEGSDVRSTQHMPFLYGSYSLGKWAIPYFSTSVTFREAAESLTLTSDLSSATDITWSVDELFQRDIDWVRVSEGIVKYLQNTERPQFFNSLTVALLPNKTGSSFEKHFSQYAESDFHAPGIEKKLFGELFEKQVGPISFGYAQEWEKPGDPGSQMGVLRWNKDEVIAVAIDGQHRLAGIKEAVDEKLIEGGIADTNRVPVIFLLFDPEVGFKGDKQKTPLDVMRMLFIDLNKHAVVVKRARQIMLDDLDPISLCVRSVIADGLTEESRELFDAEPRIPLSLVDWHSEQAKFDQGPYFTTVLGLDWIVSKVLNVSVAKDTTDYTRFRGQIKQLEDSLKIDLTETRARLKQRENDGAPFVYEAHELELIKRSFTHIWVPMLVHQFAAFTPYKELVDTRMNIGTLDAEFSNWYYMFSRTASGNEKSKSQYLKLKNALQNREQDPKSEGDMKDLLQAVEKQKLLIGTADHVKEKGSLAFNVAFQRAYFLALVDFTRFDQSDISSGIPGDLGSVFDKPSSGDDNDSTGRDQGDDDVDSNDLVAVHSENIGIAGKEFVDGMNSAVAKIAGLLDVNLVMTRDSRLHRFWDGTLRKPEGGIDFTQGGSTRAKEVIYWIASISRFIELRPNVQEFEDFWAEIKDTGRYAQQLRGSFSRFYSSETSAAARILKPLEITMDHQSMEKECERRVEFIWDSLKADA